MSDVVVAVLGSTAVFSFIQFLFQRHDRKVESKSGVQNTVKEIQNSLVKLEKDGCRTQMLVLMGDYPNERGELMTLAEHYFKDLKGDWYMSSIFAKWLKENGIENPDWFDSED